MKITNIMWDIDYDKDGNPYPSEVEVPKKIADNPKLKKEDRYVFEKHLTEWLQQEYVNVQGYTLKGYAAERPDQTPVDLGLKVTVRLKEELNPETTWVTSNTSADGDCDVLLYIEGEPYLIRFQDMESLAYVTSSGECFVDLTFTDPDPDYTDACRLLTYRTITSPGKVSSKGIGGSVRIYRDIDREDEPGNCVGIEETVSVTFFSTDNDFEPVPVTIDKNARNSFAGVQVGDIIFCSDECARDYTTHIVQVNSIECDDEYVTDTNPLGMICYVTDLEEEEWGDDYIGNVTEATYVRLYDESVDGPLPAID